MDRLKALLDKYGRVAMVTYFALFALVFAGFGLGITLGLQVDSANGGAGVLGAAYVATKLTQPLRIAVTLALTPLIDRAVDRFRKPRTEQPPE